ncbi:MAG: N-acetyl-alpha-D-glucosaminyl L-malate synthase BshA [Planctomycetota bacterium]|nr:MAG: N-acetyl-alpha-D-glucosaminyl L-malate synthase BshA [Planctomycetota bacterium]
MKIGITCYPTYGGSGTVATELGIALGKRGHDVSFIAYSMPYRFNFEPNVHYHEVQMLNYPLFEYPPYSLALAVKTAEIVESENLDLVHSHYAVPHATSAFLAKQILGGRKLKAVTTLHGTDITLVGSDPSYARITRFSIEQSDGITSVSEFLKKETRKIFEVENNIEVIPNFVDTDRFTRNVNCDDRAKFASEDEKLLIHISNFRPVKRISDVLKIFAGVRKEMPAKLLMVGDGPLRASAFCGASSLGIESDVLFMGKQAEIEKMLCLADLLLLPSQTESFGLVALEAMSCEIPVVASDVGGIPEVVRHGECGYLAPVGDVSKMTEYALKVLGDNELRKKMGKNARDYAIENFSMEEIVARYEAFYEKVLAD